MDRRSFLKVAAAMPIVVMLPATIEPEAAWMDYGNELWLGGELMARRDWGSASWRVFSDYGVLYVPEYLLKDRNQTILEFVRTSF